jgi:hypothetical protein
MFGMRFLRCPTLRLGRRTALPVLPTHVGDLLEVLTEDNASG